MKWIIIYKGLKSALHTVSGMQMYLEIGIYVFVS